MLIVTHAEVLQGVCDVEGSSSSERVATARGYNERDPVCYGVGMDDKRKHQPICEHTPGCESVRTCTFPPKTLYSPLWLTITRPP